MMDAAQIGEPPSASKLDLIRRFLRATGIQRKIDTGSFLEGYAFPGMPLFGDAAGDSSTFMDSMKAGTSALRAAYEPHRHVWQEEYESHLNWEFTEEELIRIVTFLEAPEGQHYLDGSWRMDAYINTNTEDLIEQIVREARVSLAGG